jgi:hypothetical protein
MLEAQQFSFRAYRRAMNPKAKQTVANLCGDTPIIADKVTEQGTLESAVSAHSTNQVRTDDQRGPVGRHSRRTD